MKRTDAEGHDNNRFTEGDPAQGIIATVVDETIMNNIQEELCNTVEDAGLTLDGNDETQLLQALKVILARGGDQIKASLLNTQAAGVSITGLVFDKLETKSARFTIDVMRRTDSSSVTAIFDCYAIYNEEDDDWDIGYTERGDDSGVAFVITAAGQVQYTSDTLAGANYAGSYRVTGILKVDIGV